MKICLQKVRRARVNSKVSGRTFYGYNSELCARKSLEEAYELNQKKGNCILGGMLWTKMQNRMIQTAIDLCDLGLNTIEETEEEFLIYAMVSMRQLETDAGLNAYTQGAVRDAVKDIVGVQFRNLATVGGKHLGTVRIL